MNRAASELEEVEKAACGFDISRIPHNGGWLSVPGRAHFRQARYQGCYLQEHEAMHVRRWDQEGDKQVNSSLVVLTLRMEPGPDVQLHFPNMTGARWAIRNIEDQLLALASVPESEHVQQMCKKDMEELDKRLPWQKV